MSSTTLQDFVIIVMNVSILASAGMGVRAAELRVFAAAKRTLWMAVATNLLAMPALAWGAAKLFGLSEAALLGVVLAAAAPGGGTGLLLTGLAGGNLSYAVAMVFLFLLTGGIVVPLVVTLVHPQELGFVAAMLGNALAFQVAPFVGGVLVQRFFPDTAAAWGKHLNRVGLVSLIALTLGLLITKGDLILLNGGRALAAMALCSLAGFASGFLLHEPIRNRAAFALSTGVRNLSLAILLSGLLFPDPATMIAVLSYGLLMYLMGFPAVLYYKRRIRSEGPKVRAVL